MRGKRRCPPSAKRSTTERESSGKFVEYLASRSDDFMSTSAPYRRYPVKRLKPLRQCRKGTNS